MNDTTNTTFFSPYYHEPIGVVIARLTFTTALAFAGVTGNALVCIVIASKKLRGRSSMHTYLLNLALADIGVLTTIFPLGILRERMPHYWPFGRFACLYLYPVFDTFFGASIWFITSIAYQRYQNIVKNKDLHRRCDSTKHVAFTILAIWVVSCLVHSLPLYFVMEYHEINHDVISCDANWGKTKLLWLHAAYTLSLVAFSYLLPLCVILWTYVGIWQEIRKSILFHQSLQKESGNKSRANSRTGENSRARKILTPIVVTFAVTMLPLNLFRLLSIFWTDLFYLRHFWTINNIVIIITITNSAINPIIYSIVSKDFRKAFFQLTMQGSKPTATGTFLMSRSRSDRGTQDRGTPERPSSLNRKKPQPSGADMTHEEKLKETVL